MDTMKELYEKVAKDSELQAKYAEIMKDSEKAGGEETGKKLVAFAKDAGYELTVDEIHDFFSKLEIKDGALSEEELDAVAGGKRFCDPNQSIYVTRSGCSDILVTLDLNHSACRYNI